MFILLKSWIQSLFSTNESDLVELQHANILEKGSQCTKAALSVWAGRNAGTRQLSKECSFGRKSCAKNEGGKGIQNVELGCSYQVLRKVACST